MKTMADKPASILVVEDDHRLLRFLTQALKISGYNVSAAGCAAEAHARASHEHFDLAILDIGLPDGDGIELGQALIAQFGIPFLHLTGQTDDQSIDRGVRSGAINYLVKPVSIEQLSAAVTTAISRASEVNRLIKSVEKLSGDFEDKKTVSIAVGIIMERFGLTDAEAFEVLRYAARSHQEKLQTASERLVAGKGGLELLASLNKYLRRVDSTKRGPDE